MLPAGVELGAVGLADLDVALVELLLLVDPAEGVGLVLTAFFGVVGVAVLRHGLLLTFFGRLVLRGGLRLGGRGKEGRGVQVLLDEEVGGVGHARLVAIHAVHDLVVGEEALTLVPPRGVVIPDHVDQLGAENPRIQAQPVLVICVAIKIIMAVKNSSDGL